MLLSLLSKRALEVDSRDAYGFALRPQHVEGYKDYAFIYKEEEEERSDRWKNFLEQQQKSVEPCSPEEICNEASNAEANALKEESASDRSEGGDDTTDSDSDSSASTEKEAHPTEETKTGEIQSSDRSDGGDDTSGSESSSSASTEKEVQLTKETKTRKVQTWVQIKPSYGAIDDMMSIRVKMRKNKIDKQKNAGGDCLLPTKVAEPLPVIQEENSEDYANEMAEDTEKHSMVGSDEENSLSSEPFFPWKEELECLVRGGVPKDLRGEVWQAFIGVKTRRVERYYEELLADTDAGDINKHDNLPSAPTKWIKQIEKDIPRTFPGHPALDDDGRNSLRRLLLAYSRHNPSVGYCQAMNYFAGLLLLLMPEENAFWALVGIVDDYFEGYYTEQMIESQVDQHVLEELVHERFPKLVNHLDYLGVQLTWVTASWFLSIFVNMLPWESVLRVWDVLLYEGNRVMLFRTALALMELYGPALVTTKDAGDAITLFQSLVGSTFDSSQLVMTACMGFLRVTEPRLEELREKHRPSVLQLIEERSKGLRALKDTKSVRSKLKSFKQGRAGKETKTSEGSVDKHAGGDTSHPESPSEFDEFISGLTVSSDDGLPDLEEQVDWLKVEICRLMEDKKSAVLRAEELETALAEMVKEDNRPQLISRIEQLEKEVIELQQTLHDKKEQEASLIEVLVRVEQQQRVTEDARRLAERDVATQKCAVRMLEEKYEKALTKVAKMEKRVIMAESMLEATLQYESGQIKAHAAAPGHCQSSSKEVQIPLKESALRKMSLLSRSFVLSWGDKNSGKQTTQRTEDSSESNALSDEEKETEEH